MRPQRVRFFLFVLTLVLTVASTASAQDAKPHDAILPVPRGANWMKRHESFNARVKQGNVDLLMIGDSITHGWEHRGKKVWEKFYGKRNAVNLGIGGDRTQHVIWRLDNGNIDGISPKLAVIMIGTNNAGGNTPEQIAEGIKVIVERLRKKLPKMHVLVLGIFPRGTDDNDKHRQVNMKANKIVEKMADHDMVHYLNIGEKFLDDKRVLHRKIMPDLLHLTEGGYTIWAEAIEPTVAKLMGEKK